MLGLARHGFSGIAAYLLLLPLVHCSTAASQPALDAGLCEGTPHGDVPAEHRSTAAACPATSAYGEQGDAGPPVACSTDADCAVDAAFGLGRTCLHGACGWDACLVDSDCPSGNLCGCADHVGGGNAFHGNECVPASCKVDADCGAGLYCEPSRGYCGGIEGYHCTSHSDTCFEPQTDCAGCGNGGNACVYAPQVQHFVCGSSVCNG